MKITKDNLDLIKPGVWLRAKYGVLIPVETNMDAKDVRANFENGEPYELVNVTVEPVPEPAKPLEREVWVNVYKSKGWLWLGELHHASRESAIAYAATHSNNIVGLKRIVLREGEYDE